jgi:hypothetical protein
VLEYFNYLHQRGFQTVKERRVNVKRCLIILFVTAIFGNISAKTYTVGKTGADYTTIQAVIDAMNPGDSAIVAAGTYAIANTVKISKIGTPSARFFLGTKGSNRAILDFSAMATNDTAQGLYITGNYWYIRGFDITKAGDNGVLIEANKDSSGAYVQGHGSYNTVEWCSVYRCQDAGFQIKRYGGNNKFLNCDSYFNYDDKTSGGNADGFAPKMGPGDNYFFGCRSWNNSDDGWDGYIKDDQCLKTPTTTCEYCVCYFNGYKEDGTQAGNGNGYKMGSSSTTYAHNFITRHCVSAKNYSKGFDQNHNAGSMIMINCSSYGNLVYDYYIKETNAGLTLTNCLTPGGKTDFYSNAKVTNCNWTAATTGFENVNYANLIAPRNSDGSLSDATLSFMRPTTSSTPAISLQGWIQKGVIPSPDPNQVAVMPSRDFRPAAKSGAFVGSAVTILPNITKIEFIAPVEGNLSVTVFDIAGKKVLDYGNGFFKAGFNSQIIDLGSLAKGMYLCDLKYSGKSGIQADHLKLLRE